MKVVGLAAGLTIKVSDGITGDPALEIGTATSPTAPQALVHEASWKLPATFAFDAPLTASFRAHAVGTKFDVTARGRCSTK